LKILKTAYLAGGTAAALQLGHRVSYDLDFFTRKRFDAKVLVEKLLALRSFKLEETAWGTVLGKFAGIKFSLFYYKYPLLATSQSFLGINIASLVDIAAMKVAAISERGRKRDFVDLYFLAKKAFTLEEALSFYDQKYGNLANQLSHVLKSLYYFEDAEEDEMPEMLARVSWPEIKKFFGEETKTLTKKLLNL
jgi:hypothetical protein